MSKISELTIGSNVQLTIKLGDKSAGFTSSIINKLPESKKLGCGVSIKPIISDGKMVSISKCYVEAEVLNKEDNRIYRYTINATYNDHKSGYLQIYSVQDVKPTNNRKAFRILCGFEAVVQIDEHRKAVKGFVHDISLSGASFTFEKDECSAELGNHISATVVDDRDMRHKLNGRVVRVDPNYANGKYLIGVEFERLNESITSIISRLQMKDLRLKRG